MELTVRDLMRIFDVPERMVHRWIKEKHLPTHKIQDQFRFNRIALLEWVHAQRMAVPSSLLEAGNAPGNVSLSAAIGQGGMHPHVEGRTKEEVLLAAAKLASLPEPFTPGDLVSLLLAREALTSTGIGHGIALPHVRNPIVLSIPEPSVPLCFLKNPVDFGAVDGQPVHTLFLILSPTTRVHLHILARIGYVLRDPVLLKMLGSQQPPQGILERITSLEKSFAVPH